MHPYATDSSHRVKVYWILAVAASAAAAFFSTEVEVVQASFTIPSWVSAPSAFLLFGLLVKSFDQWAWKWWLTRTFFGIDTPDLSGEWEGTLTTSFDDHKSNRPARLIIKQTWSKISVKGEFEKSRSQSTTGAIVTNGAVPVLIYGFTNQPDPNSVSTMNSHNGTAELYFENKDQALLGGYFTSRDRKNNGGLKLKKK